MLPRPSLFGPLPDISTNISNRCRRSNRRRRRRAVERSDGRRTLSRPADPLALAVADATAAAAALEDGGGYLTGRAAAHVPVPHALFPVRDPVLQSRQREAADADATAAAATAARAVCGRCRGYAHCFNNHLEVIPTAPFVSWYRRSRAVIFLDYWRLKIAGGEGGAEVAEEPDLRRPKYIARRDGLVASAPRRAYLLLILNQ